MPPSTGGIHITQSLGNIGKGAVFIASGAFASSWGVSKIIR